MEVFDGIESSAKESQEIATRVAKNGICGCRAEAKPRIASRAGAGTVREEGGIWSPRINSGGLIYDVGHARPSNPQDLQACTWAIKQLCICLLTVIEN
jgi:hypothetical protein